MAQNAVFVLTVVDELKVVVKLKNENFTTYRGASVEDIEDCLSIIRDICCTSEASKRKVTMKATAKDLKDIKELQAFIETHGKSTHYMFQLKKCASCPYCIMNPVRMDEKKFKTLSFLPCPLPDESKVHYQTFEKLYGQEVDESHRPSRNTNFDDDIVDEDRRNHEVFKSQKARDAIQCGECGKHRLVYSHNKLSEEQNAVLQRIKESNSYMCGDAMPEHSQFLVRRCLTCAVEVEVSYYSSSLRVFLPLICIYCGSEEHLLDDNNPYIAELYEKFSVVRPLCESCRSSGKEARTWGRKFFKKQRKQ